MKKLSEGCVVCVLAQCFQDWAFASSRADLGWKYKLGSSEGGRNLVPCVRVAIVPGMWLGASTVFVEWN